MSYDISTQAANGDRLWNAGTMPFDCTLYNLPPGTYQFAPRTSHDCVGRNQKASFTVADTPRLGIFYFYFYFTVLFFYLFIIISSCLKQSL